MGIGENAGFNCNVMCGAPKALVVHAREAFESHIAWHDDSPHGGESPVAVAKLVVTCSKRVNSDYDGGNRCAGKRLKNHIEWEILLNGSGSIVEA